MCAIFISKALGLACANDGSHHS